MTLAYDRQTLEELAALLYAQLPDLYRAADPKARFADGVERGELEALIRVLAVPLAVVRQSIEELHADLFVDSAHAAMLPTLAQSIGTDMALPDAEASRADLRGTMGWRRRKGTASMLREQAEARLGRPIVLIEGWERVQVIQDLNHLRPERRLALLRAAWEMSTAHGPDDHTLHLVDLRKSDAEQLRFHPRGLAFFDSPYQLYPLRRASPALAGPPAKLRYYLHPLPRPLPLRARRTHPEDALRDPRISGEGLVRSPEIFGAEGRFSVEINGLAGAVVQPRMERQPSRVPASNELVANAGTFTVLEHRTDRLRGPVKVELVALATTGAPNPRVRAAVELRPDGFGPLPTQTGALTGVVPMLKLSGQGWFPGAVLALVVNHIRARMASPDPSAAREGFLWGSLILELPSGWIFGEQWYWIASDGSLCKAPGPSGQVQSLLPAATVTGPGPAWPPLPATASPDPLRILPVAPGRGPALLHGGVLVDQSGSTFVSAPGSAIATLVFAARLQSAVPVQYRPFLRMIWPQAAPQMAEVQTVSDQGQAVPVAARLAQMAAWAAQHPGKIELLVRLESAGSKRRLAPTELAWSCADGTVVPIHLPQLRITSGAGITGWPASQAHVSPPVRIHNDGSSRDAGSGDLLRWALGAVAPIPSEIPLLRRQLKVRRLCPWFQESPTQAHPPTAARCLEIDPEHGLFALAEAPATWSKMDGRRAPNLQISLQEAAPLPVGGLPMARQPRLGQRLEGPTRLVCVSGILPAGSPLGWYQLPRYARLDEALAAIHAQPADVEVVQILDSSSYPDERPRWPKGVKQLSIQASEGECPTLELHSWKDNRSYEQVSLLGLRWRGAAIELPQAERIVVRYCTVADRSGLRRSQGSGLLRVEHSRLGGIRMGGSARVEVVNSSLDPGGLDLPGARAIQAYGSDVTLDRVTTIGRLKVRTLTASNSLCLGPVQVRDRFQGCVRYSRFPTGARLPEQHRCVHGGHVEVESQDRQDPGYLRLSTRTDSNIRSGADDGAELGVGHDSLELPRQHSLKKRLEASLPAGLRAGNTQKD